MTSLLFCACALVTLDFCRRLLAEQDGLIMACCQRLVENGRRAADELDDAACDLYNRAVEHLTANDCERLRTYRGEAKIESFLKMVISRVHIDAIVHREGKDLRRSRAVAAYGDLGASVYDLAVKEKRSVEEAWQILKFKGFRDLAMAEVATISEGVRQYTRHAPSDPDLRVGLDCADDGDDPPEPHRISGPDAEPEHRLGEAEAAELRISLVREMVTGLTGSDRMILLLKHPLDDDLPAQTFGEIARRLGMTAKQVEHQYYRVMKLFKEKILARNIRFDDVASL